MTKPLVALTATVLLASSLAACGYSTEMRSDTATDIVTPASADLPPVETSPEIFQIINASSIVAAALRRCGPGRPGRRDGRRHCRIGYIESLSLMTATVALVC